MKAYATFVKAFAGQERRTGEIAELANRTNDKLREIIECLN